MEDFQRLNSRFLVVISSGKMRKRASVKLPIQAKIPDNFRRSTDLPFRLDPLTYSHSIVPGGLEVISYTTRFTPRTSLTIRLEIVSRRS